MPAVTGANTFTSNYNNFIASGTGGTLGYYNASNVTSTNITSVDANSVSINPAFGADLTLKSSFTTAANLPAQVLSDVLTDLNDNPRNALNPLMGAVESSSATTTVSVYNGSNLLASYGNLKQIGRASCRERVSSPV